MTSLVHCTNDKTHLHGMFPDSAGPLLNEFLGNSFLFEGHKAEVFGFVVLGLVNGPNNLHNAH